MTGAAILVPAGALAGTAVGLSVSDSADLARLGLAPRHCELAVAEIARAVLIAGGSLVYGGRLVPTGYTHILLDEVRRFGEDRDALTICLAASEHRKLSNEELLTYIDDLHVSAQIVCLGEDGRPVRPTDRGTAEMGNQPRALSGLRRYVTEVTHARILVGGQLGSFQGAMPGVVEEALLAVKAGQPVYAAGGFGGAAAAVAAALGHDDLSWAPPEFPAFVKNAEAPLAELAALATDGLSADGLDDEARRQLATTYRPADIAALVVLGLSRVS